MTSGKLFTCALLATLTLALVCRAADESRVLTRVGDIRALSREEAAKALPVRLHGVVIWQNVDLRPGFILHDGERKAWTSVSEREMRALKPSGSFRYSFELASLIFAWR